MVSLGVAGVFLVLCTVCPARAQEKIATHPSLPSTYSSIKVFDRTGRYIGRIPAEGRYRVSLDRIPKFLQNALIAVEDARFYEHGGIDVRGIARALVKDVIKRRMAEGGSTITQQLIKNRYLSGEKTIDRKLKEARLAMEFERKFTKKQILEMYFNEIYFGNGAWGIAQASRIYFDKNPEQLTDAECALLAGVPKAPARYNPLGKPAAVTGRRDVVLERMVDLQMITPLQKQRLRGQHVTFVQPNQCPQFLGHIRDRLVKRYGKDIVERGGLDVIAAMDLTLQKKAENAVSEGVRRVSHDLQGSLLCLDPATGDVLAAVGGVDAGRDSYDRAFIARRQPGSAIKPLIYAAALEKGFTVNSRWNDSPVRYDRGNGDFWQPSNYGNEFKGELSLRQALAYSNNIISVKLLEAIGVPYFTEFAGKLGLTLHAENGLSLALGTEEVSLNELVSAYASFANGGMLPKSRTILRIYDRNRRVWTENPPSLTPALSPATAFLTTNMLVDVMVYGTAKTLESFSRAHPSAGKTGTTNNYRDAWFIGYTPRLVTGVWVGYDKPRPGGKGFTGGAVSAPIWGHFMRSVPAAVSGADFIKPESVVSVQVDPATGFLATPDCPARREEYFMEGTEPVRYCPEHGGDALPPVPRPDITGNELTGDVPVGNEPLPEEAEPKPAGAEVTTDR